MGTYSIDHAALVARRERAEKRSAAGEGPAIAARLRAGEALDDEALASLLLADDVATDDLLGLARSLRAAGGPQIETFSPLYITNHCDAECLMCGMRRFNDRLQRETADEGTVRHQLGILHERGIRGVALLTGEYRHGALRREMLARTTRACNDALELGFTHVLINVGSIEEHEYDELLAGVPRDADGSLSPRVTMCTFQETYDRGVYEKFMGATPENPRADFGRRLSNFDRASDAGMRSANPGVLLGLNHDVAFEVLALLEHSRHLLGLGMQVYVSLPRLRKASGAEHRGGISDDELARVVAVLSAGLPEAKVVISTREIPEIQHRLLPVISVLTAGSPGVAPYTDANARFEVEASQFEVADQRPFEVILGEALDLGATIQGYEPPGYEPEGHEPTPTPTTAPTR
jgi:3-methyl-2-indolic acid synthase